jgi:hypothetical protein
MPISISLDLFLLFITAGVVLISILHAAGFEAGGRSTPSILDPWYKVGDGSQVVIGTELSSPFLRNSVALKVEVFCGDESACPSGGVGAANPGFWGMVSEANPIISCPALSTTSINIQIDLMLHAERSGWRCVPSGVLGAGRAFFYSFCGVHVCRRRHCPGARATQVQAEPM